MPDSVGHLPNRYSHLPSWITAVLNCKGQKHAQTTQYCCKMAKQNDFYVPFSDTQFPSLPCSQRRQGDKFGPLRCAKKSAVSLKERCLMFSEHSPMPLGAGTWSTNSFLLSIPAFLRILFPGRTHDHRHGLYTLFPPFGFMSLDYSRL